MEEKILKTLWLDPKFFVDEVPATTYSEDGTDRLNRAFEIWEFANKEILESTDKEGLNSGILALKRAYNKTIQIVNESFGLQQFGRKKGNKGDMVTLLEDFGIIKTKTLNKFFDIRNMIEHQDVAPPEKETCIMYSEYMWCLLKIISSLYHQYDIGVYFKNKYGFLTFEFRTVKQEKEYRPKVFVNGAIAYDLVSFVEKATDIKFIDVVLVEKFAESEIKFFCCKAIDGNNKIYFKAQLENILVKKFIKEIILNERRYDIYEKFGAFFERRL